MWPTRPVPWAFLLAVLILLGVELAVRQLDPAEVIPYERVGRLSYSAVRQYLTFIGPAETAIVGSSRAREALAMPQLRAQLERALGRPITVANYATPGSGADIVNATVRLMLRHEKRPVLLLYGVTPAALAVKGYDLDKRASFWNLGDWCREASRSGIGLSRLLPEVIRNEIEGHYRTFAYRKKIALLLKQHTSDYQPPSCPIRGDLSARQASDPDRSLVNRPVSPARVKRYLSRRMEGSSFPLGGLQREAMESTIRLCNEERVEVILVELPQAEILQRYYPNGMYDEFVSMVSEIAIEHGVRFVPLDHFKVEFTDADFGEQSHLNLHGARRFTAALANQVVIPALEEGERDRSAP